MSNVGKVKGERMAAPRPLLTKGQKRKLLDLMMDHRFYEGVPHFEGYTITRDVVEPITHFPTIQAMLKYVGRLIQAERRYWEKRRGLR